MDRRTALRTLATASAIPLFAPEGVSALLEARRVLTPGTRAHFAPAALSVNELEMVGVIADIILPRTDTPSATDLDVPGFVDLIASEWMDEDEASELHAGLATLDATASTRFGRGFSDATVEAQLTLVRELDAALPASGSPDVELDGFYPTLKRLVLVGYFTTEEAAGQVGYRIIPGQFGGCVAPEAGR